MALPLKIFFTEQPDFATPTTMTTNVYLIIIPLLPSILLPLLADSLVLVLHYYYHNKKHDDLLVNRKNSSFLSQRLMNF
jgi:hypothetical protein